MTTTTRRTLDQHHSIIEAAHDYGIMLDGRELFYYGEVDGDGELGNHFLTNMRILISKSSTKPIIIHQHSLGGDWACGMMIFDAVVTCPCPIVFVCHGLAASMGSIIPMSCIQHPDAYIINMPNCDWLIHDGTTGILPSLTYKQSRSWGEWEKRTRDIMINLYVKACRRGKFHKGRSEKQIKAYIKRQLDSKEDWWLTPEEAVEHGFADAVLGDKDFETIQVIKGHWD